MLQLFDIPGFGAAGEGNKGYSPGSPGGPWTDEEVLIVKEKVLVMTNPDNAKTLYSDENRFPPIVNEVFGNVWHPEDPSNKHWFNKSFPRTHPELAPTTRKLVRLAFHDCLKNKDEEGNRFGGCDGCLNWENMDWMNEVPLGNMAHTSPVWPSFRAEPIQYTTDNNKLSTTVYALEWIYVDPSWPPGTPELPESLLSTGKSRADLWQLAANTALEIEMARANYGCSHKVSFQQMVTALEGKENCLWRLEKPVPFQYGRADCVRKEEDATTDFPFEATTSESHPNSFGQASTVLEDLKEDFGMTARQSIALMAAHGIATHSHNKVLGIEYRWAGSPFISNLYFKTLASKPQYNLGAGLSLNDYHGDGVLAGDKFGRPLNRDVQGNFCLHTNDWWNTSLPDSGPFFFRPMTTNAPGTYDEDLRPRFPCFKWNKTTEIFDRNTEVPACLSEEVTIDKETGVQYGGPAITHTQSWGFTFYLPYEMNFVKEFDVDSENHPRGCNFPDVYPEWGTDEAHAYGQVPINCTRTNFKLDGESQTSADIVDEFAESHQAWAREFIEGWQASIPSSYRHVFVRVFISGWNFFCVCILKANADMSPVCSQSMPVPQMIQKSGYGESLTDGPHFSWLGYSMLPEGLIFHTWISLSLSLFSLC